MRLVCCNQFTRLDRAAKQRYFVFICADSESHQCANGNFQKTEYDNEIEENQRITYHWWSTSDVVIWIYCELQPHLVWKLVWNGDEHFLVSLFLQCHWKGSLCEVWTGKPHLGHRKHVSLVHNIILSLSLTWLFLHSSINGLFWIGTWKELSVVTIVITEAVFHEVWTFPCDLGNIC